MARSDLESVLLEVQAKGFELSSFIIDGRNHRFKLEARDHKKSGSYRAFRTKHGIEIQIYSFRDSEMQLRYRLTGERKLSEEEIREHETEIEDRKKRQNLRTTLIQQTVAIESEAKLRQACSDPLHPLLARRGLHANYGGKVYGSLLLVPCRDIEGRLWSVQSLGYAHGNKGYFPSGAKQKGCLHLIGEVGDGPIFVTEGFLTGASLYQLSGKKTVAVAFSANNLTEVALALRKKYPKAELIISGDRDDTGIKNSNKAAKLAKARVLIPDFGINHPEFKDWNDFYKQELEGGVPMAVEQLKNYRQKSQSGEFETWFMEWIDKGQLTMSFRGEFSFGELSVTKEFVESKLFLDANQTSKSFGQSHCRSALQMWAENERRRMQDELIKKVTRFEPNQELERFVEAITSDNLEVNTAVMKHFIWQVKRKMLGLPVKRHLMPVITGDQNSGKSQAVFKFLSPIELVTINKNVDALTDDKQYPMFRSYFVIFLDEMAKADKANNECLKHVITAPNLYTRKFFGQTQLFIQNNATLIGTSNYPLETLIKDPTGMRRFHEIKSLPVCNWDLINQIDYLKVWNSVDANEPIPFIEPHLASIRDAQEEFRHRSDCEEWRDEVHARPDSAGKILLKTAWEKSYIPWAKSSGVTMPRSPQGFGLELKRLGFKNFRSHGKRYIEASIDGVPNLL